MFTRPRFAGAAGRVNNLRLHVRSRRANSALLTACTCAPPEAPCGFSFSKVVVDIVVVVVVRRSSASAAHRSPPAATGVRDLSAALKRLAVKGVRQQFD